MQMTVVVPVYNRARDLDRCLEAICGNDPPPDQVIVVDDGSTDGSAEVAEAHGCDVRRIDHRGSSHARNAGAREAAHEIVVFVDSDVEIGPRDLGRLAGSFADSDICAAYGVFDPGARVEDRLGDYNNLTQHWVFARHPGETRLCHTSFIAVRKEAFLASGGFDDGWDKAVADDVILGWRLLRAGCRMCCRGDVAIKHHKSFTVRGFVRSRFHYGYEWSRAARKYRGLVDGTRLDQPDLVNSVRTPVNVLLCYGLAASVLGGPLGFGAAGVLGAGFVYWNRGFLRFVARERNHGFAALSTLLLLGETLLTSTGLAAGIASAPWTSVDGR